MFDCGQMWSFDKKCYILFLLLGYFYKNGDFDQNGAQNGDLLQKRRSPFWNGPLATLLAPDSPYDRS